MWAAMIRTLLADQSLLETDRHLPQQHFHRMDSPQKLVGLVNDCMARKIRDPNKMKIIYDVVGIPEAEAAVTGLFTGREGEFFKHSSA